MEEPMRDPGTAPFTGVGVALVTLFAEDGSVDTRATAAHAARLVECGVRAVLVAGTTGEAMALEPTERVALVKAVREAIPAGVAMIAGTGAASGRQAAELTRAAVDAGADAVLALSPPMVTDPRAYYQLLAEVTGEVPLLAYHLPGLSAPGVPVDLLDELPVAGLKDSSGDPVRLLREVVDYGGFVYVGSPTVLTMAGAVGAHGALLAVANAAPELCVAAFEGDGKAQRELLAYHRAAKASYPDGVKRLTSERFGTSDVARVGS
jgi:4-hydroxy-tetrahydrodipicolinate synthase